MDLKELLDCLAQKEKDEKSQVGKVIKEVLSAFKNNSQFLTNSQSLALDELKSLYEEFYQPYSSNTLLVESDDFPTTEDPSSAMLPCAISDVSAEPGY